MDLTAIKFAWSLLQDTTLEEDKVDKQAIQRALYHKSKSEIAIIRRSLHIKFIIATMAILIAVALACMSVIETESNPMSFIFSPTESLVFYSVLALSVSIMVFYNYAAYQQMKLVERSSLNLKENLIFFIKAMNRAIDFNIFSDTLMTPIIFTWVYYAYAFKNRDLELDLRTALLFILPILIGILSFFTQKFMQQLKFGKYLDELKVYLNELQKNPNHL